MQRFIGTSSRMAPRPLARLSASSRASIAAMPVCQRLLGREAMLAGLRFPASVRCLSSEALAQRQIPSLDGQAKGQSSPGAQQTNAASSSGDEYVPVEFSTYTAVHPKTQMAIDRIMNFRTASKVQHQIISRLPITGDIMVKAKTGTGKTAAFLVPAIESLLREYEKDPERKLKGRSVGCLIVSPTRELAKQICSEAEKLVKFHGWNVQSLIGGERPRDQLNSLARSRSDIVIGTPGRILDFLSQQQMFADMASKTRLLILDEADVLLQMGFRKELDEIIKMTPADRQTFLVSATMDRKVRELAPVVFHRGFDLIDCVEKGETNTHLNVKQEYVQVEYSQHFGVICDIIQSHINANKAEGRGSKVIVFLATVKGADMYAKILRTILKKGESAYASRQQSRSYNQNRWSPQRPSSGTHGEVVSVEVLHGKISQDTRSRTSSRFRSSEPTVNNTSILVTTDVSARGVDYPDVSLVVQVGVPSESDAYIHRLGRTGRAGKSGEGVILLNPVEMAFLKHLKGIPVKQSEKYTPEYINSLDGFAGGAIAHLAPRWEAVLVNTEMERVQDAFVAMVGFYQGHLDMIGEPRGQDIIDASASILKPFNAPQPPLPSLLRASLGIDRSPSSGGNRRRLGGGYGNRQSSSSYGNDRRSFGGSFGGERRSFGGERRSFDGERKSFGGERRSFDGERKSFSGERSSFGGGHRSYGDRSSFDGERKPYGDRKPFDGERKSFNGERRSHAPWIKRGSQSRR
ncbi:hypothetical protein IWW37_000276 [Coemansia sp. RSA 2050]|nr:hypothetical protein IWW37_000276 [Coemansia sp. RSA 2050]